MLLFIIDGDGASDILILLPPPAPLQPCWNLSGSSRILDDVAVLIKRHVRHFDFDRFGFQISFRLPSLNKTTPKLDKPVEYERASTPSRNRFFEIGEMPTKPSFSFHNLLSRFGSGETGARTPLVNPIAFPILPFLGGEAGARARPHSRFLRTGLLLFRFRFCSTRFRRQSEFGRARVYDE